MTVQTVVRRNDYIGSNILDTYDYEFKIFLDSDLRISVEDLSGLITLLVLDVDYTVLGAGDPNGGTVTLVSGIRNYLYSDQYLKTGYLMAIRSDVDITQLTDLRNRGGFFPVDHEKVFDKLTMICLQQQDEIDRSLKTPETESTAIILPSATQRSNKFLAFDNNGDLDLVVVVGSNISDTAFVPVVTFGGVGITASYNVATGKAMRIGNLVIARVVLDVDTISHSLTSDLLIMGFPFLAANGLFQHRGAGGVVVDGYVGWAADKLTGYVAEMEIGSGDCKIRADEIDFAGSAVVHRYLTGSDIPTGSLLKLAFSVIYETGDV